MRVISVHRCRSLSSIIQGVVVQPAGTRPIAAASGALRRCSRRTAAACEAAPVGQAAHRACIAATGKVRLAVEVDALVVVEHAGAAIETHARRQAWRRRPASNQTRGLGSLSTSPSAQASACGSAMQARHGVGGKRRQRGRNAPGLVGGALRAGRGRAGRAPAPRSRRARAAARFARGRRAPARESRSNRSCNRHRRRRRRAPSPAAGTACRPARAPTPARPRSSPGSSAAAPGSRLRSFWRPMRQRRRPCTCSRNTS